MPPEPQSHEQERAWSLMMRAAQAGDAQRYTQLLGEIAPFVRSLVRRYCRDPQLAEDVVQDVLMTVHRVRHTWDPKRPFTPWLAAISGRRAIDRIRRESRIARHEVRDDEALATFAAPAANNESGALRSAEALAPLLAALPQQQRYALEAVKIRGLSVANAASESGQSVSALKVNVHRAIKALRKLVGSANAPDDADPRT